VLVSRLQSLPAFAAGFLNELCNHAEQDSHGVASVIEAATFAFYVAASAGELLGHHTWEKPYAG